MINVFFGNDTVKVRQKAFGFVDENKQDREVVLLEANQYENGLLSEMSGGVSLFGGRKLFVLDTWSENDLAYEALVDNLDSLQESGNDFVIIEGSLLVGEKKKFEKWVDEMVETKKEASRDFNSFSLADALSKKDKKSLWLLWNEALLEGKSAEELSGVLWWQLKTLRLAAVAKDAEEAGLKDFPYQKAKRALPKFKTGELENLSRELLSVIHDSRLGGLETPLAIERWILKL